LTWINDLLWAASQYQSSIQDLAMLMMPRAEIY